MAITSVQAVIGKAMVDDAFRAQFLADPETAANGEGLFLTADEVSAILSVKDELKKMGDELGAFVSGPSGASSFVDIHVGAE